MTAGHRTINLAKKMNVSPGFISIGGNRNPAAADWDLDGSHLLAYGADNSIALWDPSVGNEQTFMSALLTFPRINNSAASKQF